MEISFEPLILWLQSNYVWLEIFWRVICIIAVLFLGFFLLKNIWGIPVRVRFGPIKLENVIKLIVSSFVLCWHGAAIYSLLFFTPLIVAKLLLINSLVVGSFACLIIFLSTGRMNVALTQIQQECEIATNLTFLQGEMTRAQLEALNEKVRKALQPEEREITETMLRSLSPIVMLYFKKEKSIMKWSMAAMNAGKDLVGFYFNSNKSNG